MKKKIFILIIFAFGEFIFAQEQDISSALKDLEAGNLKAAEMRFQVLKEKSPNDPSVLFLDAVLTKDGNEANKKYFSIFQNFSKSKYADAALFRSFSYNFSLGYYKKAETLLTTLKEKYPTSPYIKAADRKIPDEEETIIIPQKNEPLIKKTETPINKSSNFTIQVGAFLNNENARKVNDQLINDGYPSEINIKEIGGSNLNVVTAGAFCTEEEAQKALDRINSKYNLKGRIIPFPKPNANN